MLKILAGLLLSVGLLSSTDAAPPKGIESTHSSVQVTVFGGGHCSPTAIGRKAILTASHCELPTNEIRIDGHRAVITATIRDKFDHTVYILDGVEFQKWAKFAHRKPVLGEKVHIFGRPGGWPMVFRSGEVANVDTEVDMYGLVSFPGDSGSAIFNEDGEILDVLSFGTCQRVEGDEVPPICLTGAYPMSEETIKDFEAAASK